MRSESSHFLKALALLPLAATAVSATGQPSTVAQNADAATAGRWCFHHENVLGTSLQIAVRAATPQAARRAESAALAAFDRDAAILSTWRADSEASRWAATRFEAVPVSPELFDVLSAYDTWREQTDGALDPSVAAATGLWQRTTAQGRVPTALEIAETREAMQQPHWQLDVVHRTATRLSDVPLAFASFTKSYITSRAADAALRAGARGIVLNVGGDVVVRGDMAETVRITDPHAYADNAPALAQITVRDGAVATSGSYLRGFELAGARRGGTPQFSHLFDARTARPAAHVVSSTVIAKDAVTAGALATALSVLPLDEGRRLAAAFPGAQYLLVLPGGEQQQSAGWPSRPALMRTAYRIPANTGATTTAWNPAFKLDVQLTLPRIESPRYRRPYVAVWIEDADHFPVRTLALWTQNPRWLPDLKQWYGDDQIRTMVEGTDVSRTVSSATRPPGEYHLVWDGKDNAGKAVKPGTYTVCVEVARENGGYDVQKHAMDLRDVPQQFSAQGAGELGAVAFDYGKR